MGPTLTLSVHMKKLWLPIILLFLTPCLLFCETLKIRNNVKTPLNATVYKDSNVVFSVVLSPGQMYMWNDNAYSAGNKMKGPFSIVFTCKSGATWGTIRHANWGFTYNASAATGSKRCP